jgi:hypothetical protein
MSSNHHTHMFDFRNFRSQFSSFAVILLNERHANTHSIPAIPEPFGATDNVVRFASSGFQEIHIAIEQSSPLSTIQHRRHLVSAVFEFLDQCPINFVSHSCYLTELAIVAHEFITLLAPWIHAVTYIVVWYFVERFCFPLHSKSTLNKKRVNSKVLARARRMVSDIVQSSSSP